MWVSTAEIKPRLSPRHSLPVTGEAARRLWVRAFDACFAQPCAQFVLALEKDAIERLRSLAVAGRTRGHTSSAALQRNLMQPRDLEASVARTIDDGERENEIGAEK